MALVAELLVIAVVTAIGVRIRSWTIAGLGLMQLGFAIAEAFLPRSHAEAAPSFVADPLALILVLVVSVIGSIIVLYAIGYMDKHEHHAAPTAAGNPRFFMVLVGFLGMMNGLVLANDLRCLSIFWEATTLCSFLLIGYDGTDDARHSARRALLINAFGGAALMAGSLLSVSAGGGESLSSLTASKAVIPIALLCLAAFTKAAQMPFQSWLLGAMVAPTPVSALLHSATMVKAGSYLVLRLAPAFVGTKLSAIIAVAGAFTFAATAALAVGQSNGKKVLAYSTISNLGLIVTCAGINTPLAYAAALMILCFHAASKGLLFLCMGTIEQSIGSRDIEDMGGIMYLMPATTTIALIGMVSMLVPPFGMLLSKWLSIEAAIHSPLILVLLVAGSALTVLFWAKWIGRIQTVSYHPRHTLETLPRPVLPMMVLLAAMVVLAGLGAMPIYKYWLEPLTLAPYAGAHLPAAVWQVAASAGNIPTWPIYLLLVVALLAFQLTVRRFGQANVRQPFLCGENVEGIQRTYIFRSLMDKQETAWTRSYYLKGVFTESRMTFWANQVAAMIVLTMFGVLGVL